MYAKLENNKLIYAPKNLQIDDKLILNFNKNIELMRQHGYKEVVDVKPSYDSNTHYLTIDGYTEDENNITVNYEFNEIVVSHEPTLEERIAELEVINQQQDELINITMLATDEMFMMLEPLLMQTVTLQEGGDSKMVDMYVAMVQRGLKTIDQVPARYREQVREILIQLEG